MVLTPEELRERYIGAQVVMVTPFKGDHSLDEEGLRMNTKFLMESGVHVLQPCGSTGEFWSLSPEEHKRVIRIVVEEAGGRVPVVPGTSHSGTRMTVELSRYAEEVGADGVMIVPPYYEKPTPEGVYQHYKAVAEAIRIGIVVYNNPGTSKFTIGPELMERLAEIPNIVAVKETTGDMSMALRLLEKTGCRLTYSMGTGEILAPYFYMSGARGHVTGLGNFAPRVAVEMYELAARREWDRLIELHKRIFPYLELNERLSERHGGSMYITLIKEAMRLMGLPGWPPRKPLITLRDDEREELIGVLKRMGLLK